jgi:hypothetical protein
MSISSTFYACNFRTKALFSSYVLAKKALLCKKCVHKMLMKLTPGVNFINILHKAFTCTDPNSTKNTLKPLVFCAFGICLHKYLYKLNVGEIDPRFVIFLSSRLFGWMLRIRMGFSRPPRYLRREHQDSHLIRSQRLPDSLPHHS